MDITKTCTKCKEPKLLDKFYKQKTGLLGLTAECKVCRNERTRIYTNEHREERNARYRLKVRDRTEYNEKWRKENPNYFNERRAKIRRETKVNTDPF
jgi:hypothetical protein